MRYFLMVVFTVLAALLWYCVYRSLIGGVVQKPTGNAWWRDPKYYERDVAPIRFWFSVTFYATMSALATAAAIQCLA